jgi:hypothetical protein
MITHSCRVLTAVGLMLLTTIASVPVRAKGGGRSFRLSGTIDQSPETSHPEQFILTGDLEVIDCSDRTSNCDVTQWQRQARIVATVRFKGNFFVADDPVISAGAVREPRTVLSLISDAAAHQHPSKLKLLAPIITFGPAGNVEAIETEVTSMTDYHLSHGENP